MRRVLLAVIVVPLGLLGQTSVLSPEKTEDHSASACLVAGRVATAAEGSPLKSARVALVAEHWKSENRVYAATTDDDGRFLLKDVAPGRYHFFATRAGFVDQEYQSQGTDGGAPLSLKPGQKIDDVLFRMTAAGVITGRVVNEENEAMSHIQIVALRRPAEEEEDEPWFASRKQTPIPVASGHTDDRGQYRIFGLKPGEYYVRATDSFEPDSWGIAVSQDYWIRQNLGSEYAPVYYPGVLQVGQAQVVSVRPGDEVQADFSLQRLKTVEVAGRVIGPEGPVKNVSVHLEQSGVDGTDRQDTTDDKGNFRIKGVPPGSYVIMAYQRAEGEHVYEAQGREKVEVGGENIESLTIFLGRGATVRGRITVAGAGSVTLDRVGVGLLPTEGDEQFGERGRVKKDGSFEITSVKDGSYAISLWGLDHEWYIKSARLGPDDVLEKGLQVEKGVSGGRLEITISSASAQLEGSVTDGDRAMIGARVRITPDPETPYNRSRAYSATTDQTGRFSVAALAPGKYRAIAKSQALPGSESLKSEPQTITLSEHDHQTVALTMVTSEAH